MALRGFSSIVALDVDELLNEDPDELAVVLDDELAPSRSTDLFSWPKTNCRAHSPDR